MELLDFKNINYLIDEFGRIVIQNEDILEQIRGAGELELLNDFSNNKCRSNGLCGNAGCENLRC